MSMVQSIRIAMVKKGNLSEAELARRVGVTPQNFNHKMKRDNFTEKDLQEIADALGLKLEISFVDPETGEKIYYPGGYVSGKGKPLPTHAPAPRQIT